MHLCLNCPSFEALPYRNAFRAFCVFALRVFLFSRSNEENARRMGFTPFHMSLFHARYPLSFSRCVCRWGCVFQRLRHGNFHTNYHIVYFCTLYIHLFISIRHHIAHFYIVKYVHIYKTYNTQEKRMTRTINLGHRPRQGKTRPDHINNTDTLSGRMPVKEMKLPLASMRLRTPDRIQCVIHTLYPPMDTQVSQVSHGAVSTVFGTRGTS